MKKIVVKLSFKNEKAKKKPMEAVSSIGGVISMSIEGDKITVIGDVDPVQVVKKLQKWVPQLDTVGPAKEEKKEEKKPVEDKEAAAKKAFEEETAKRLAWMQQMYPNSNYYYPQPTYVHTYDDNTNSCVIC